MRLNHKGPLVLMHLNEGGRIIFVLQILMLSAKMQTHLVEQYSTPHRDDHGSFIIKKIKKKNAQFKITLQRRMHMFA